MFFVSFIIRIGYFISWNRTETTIKNFVPPSINFDTKIPDAISQTMASSNNPSKTTFFIFKIEFVFDQKIVDEIGKKKKISWIWKNWCRTVLSIETLAMNLFKKVLLSNAKKITPFEKNSKNTFLVNSKKWKKWETVSSKWNHPKVALTKCPYFVNSDPHAKNDKNLSGFFREQISFSGI